jgi:hypothetical protein
MSRVVHPGSKIRILIFYPSRIQGSKRHRIPDPDPQHWLKLGTNRFFIPVLLFRNNFVPSPEPTIEIIPDLDQGPDPTLKLGT